MQAIKDGWAAGTAVPPVALYSLVESVPEAIENPTYSWNFAMISRIAYGDLTGLNDWLFKMCCDHAWALDAVRHGAEARPPIPTDGPSGETDPAAHRDGDPAPGAERVSLPQGPGRSNLKVSCCRGVG